MANNVGLDRSAMPCTLCGGAAFELVYEDCEDVIYGFAGPPVNIVRCRGCSLAQARPRLTQREIDGYYGEGYARWARGADRRGRARSVRTGLKLAHRHRFGAFGQRPPRMGARMLVIGAGAGPELAPMSKLGWRVWVVEPDPAAAPNLLARDGVERMIAERAEELDLGESSFDLITFPHSIEHLEDPVGVVRRAHDWLREDGELRVQTPNFDSRERRVFGRYWNGLDAPRHLHLFSPTTLVRLLHDAGFEIERIATQFQGSSFAGSIQHVTAKLAGGRPYKPSGLLYSSAVPVGWLLSLLRNGAFLEVSARRPSPAG